MLRLALQIFGCICTNLLRCLGFVERGGYSVCNFLEVSGEGIPTHFATVERDPRVLTLVLLLLVTIATVMWLRIWSSFVLKN